MVDRKERATLTELSNHRGISLNCGGLTIVPYTSLHTPTGSQEQTICCVSFSTSDMPQLLCQAVELNNLLMFYFLWPLVFLLSLSVANHFWVLLFYVSQYAQALAQNWCLHSFTMRVCSSVFAFIYWRFNDASLFLFTWWVTISQGS